MDNRKSFYYPWYNWNEENVSFRAFACRWEEKTTTNAALLRAFSLQAREVLTSGSLMNSDTSSFSSNENKMAAITAFWNRRGVVGSQPTDPQLNSSRESADTGKLLTSCYGRLILFIRFCLSEICLNTQAYILRSFYNINLVTLLLITLTSTLIIPYIKESESINDCLIIHCFKENIEKHFFKRNAVWPWLLDIMYCAHNYPHRLVSYLLAANIYM